jgi:hypothetical protein
MITVERYLRHERLYTALLFAGLLFINNTINATSILMESSKAGRSVPISQPFITEYSSALATLLLIPAVIWLVGRFPLRWGQLKRSLLAHVGFSVAFSVAHISLFVVLRKAMFGLQGIDYQFSENLLLSFVYEYRKDAWLYVLILVCVHSYRFVLSRLRGEAVPVASNEDAPVGRAPERFLVRKLGKEFVVKVDDVEWLEAAGNYVNLHMQDRVYPLRATMTSLIDSLADRGFVRVHRSCGVNLDYVDAITPLESGGCDVNMKSGHSVTLSRRYRDNFRKLLNQHMSGDSNA